MGRGRTREGAEQALTAFELFASSQEFRLEASGGEGRDLLFLAVFNFQSRASSQVDGSFKNPGANGMISNMLSSRKIIHRPHQRHEDGTGLSVCVTQGSRGAAQLPWPQRACPSPPAHPASREGSTHRGWGGGREWVSTMGSFVRPRKESGGSYRK